MTRMNMKLRSDTLIRYLIPSSLFYLALPYFIFVMGWLKLYLALFYVSLIALSLYIFLRRIDRICKHEQEKTDKNVLGGRVILLVVLVVLVFLGISGVGGFGYQDTDWLKHNAILMDLVERPWLVVYQLGEEKLPLVYFIQPSSS